MMTEHTPNIAIPVDLTNPGHFFACCGLLELADRLWPGAEGLFENEESKSHFQIAAAPQASLHALLVNLPRRRTLQSCTCQPKAFMPKCCGGLA